MRSLAILATFVLLLIAPGSSAASPPDASGGPYHIVLARRALSAGEEIEMRLLPPVPRGVFVSWPTASGTDQLIYSAKYRAPFVIPPGTPPARVSVGISAPGWKTTVTEEIELLPSSVPGAEDCLGPGQSFSTAAGTIVPEYTPADVLPEVVHSVAPDYPRSDWARGIEGTVPVRALLCRTGRVLAAYVLPRYARPGVLEPIPLDPKMAEAAVAAVRQYVFTPAIKSGQPMATWIDVPVPFRR